MKLGSGVIVLFHCKCCLDHAFFLPTGCEVFVPFVHGIETVQRGW